MKRIIVLVAVVAVCLLAFAQAEPYDIGKDITISTETWEQAADDWAWTITHNLFFLNPR